MDYYSAISKKGEILPFVRPWTDLEDIMLNKSGGEGWILYDFINVWNIKIIYTRSVFFGS